MFVTVNLKAVTVHENTRGVPNRKYSLTPRSQNPIDVYRKTGSYYTLSKTLDQFQQTQFSKYRLENKSSFEVKTKTQI